MKNNALSVIPLSVFEINPTENPTMLKGRARIFYTGLNRNRTYITEEFAESLLQTIPYTPVKGIWDVETNDYGQHGQVPAQGKIYGVVPESYNLAWEEHADDDGIIRKYACVDVYIYTGIYKEAEEIVGKALSMELYRPSIKGKWTMEEGIQCYKYSEGCFLGLQVLGNEVEPCFEGAAFYSLLENLNELCAAFEKKQIEGGKCEVPKINFKLSDRDKYMQLWDALNPNYSEEGDWEYAVDILDVYDDYCLCYELESGSYFHQHYSVGEDEAVTLGDKVEVFVVDVTSEELAALTALRALSEVGTYARAVEMYNEAVTNVETLTENVNTLTAEKETLSTSVADYTAQNIELTTKVESLTGELAEATNNYTVLETEANELREFKANVVKAQKMAIINKYSAKLDDSIVDSYTAKIDDYSTDDLEKELSYQLVKNTPDIFSMQGNGYIPKDEPLTGIEAILSKYKK